VENAIYHGVRQKTEPGKVVVKVYEQGNVLWLKVSDNGPGIKREELAKLKGQIQLDKNPFIGYGLYNVNKRIMLRYGNEYKLEIDSVEGLGTIVTIRYPLIYERGLEYDV
jgi:two-component system sensor histidine kinase YesM